MRWRKVPTAVVFLSAALFSTSVWAADKTWNGANNTTWSTAGNWTGGVPGVNDRAIIPVVARQPTVTATTTINQLLVQPGATVTINNGVTLNVDGGAVPVIDGTGTVTGAGTLAVTGGVNNGVVINSTMTLGNFTYNAAGVTMGIPSGRTVTFNGNVSVPAGSMQVGDAAGAASTIDINGNLTVAGTLGMRAAASQMRLSGNLNFSGTWTPGTSTVTIDTTANMTMTFSAATYTFFNVTITTDAGANQISGDLITPNNGFTILGDLAITRGQFQVGNFTVTVNGNVTSGLETQSQLDFTSTGVFECKGNVDLGSLSQITTATNGPFATILMDGTTPQTFRLRATTASAYFDLDAFVVNNPTTVTVQNNPNADFTVNGQLQIQGSTTLVIQDVFDPESPLIFTGAGTLRLENIISSDSTIMGSTFTPATGTVEFAGTGINQIVYAQQNSGAAIQYYNLKIDNSGGAIATQQAAPLIVLNNFTVGTAATPNSIFTAANGQTITVGNDFIGNATFNAGTGTVVMTSAQDGAGRIAADVGAPFGLTFNNLTVSGAVLASPNGSPVAALQTAAGNVTPGAHSYVVSFIDANNFESDVGPASNVVVTDAAHGKVDLSLIPVGPAGTVRRQIYRTVAGNTGTPLFLAEITDNTTTTYTDNTGDLSLGAQGALRPQPASALTAVMSGTAGNVTTGTHSYKVTFVDTNNFEGAPGPSSATVNVSALRQVNLSAIPTGGAGVAKRRIYRTVSGNGGNWLFLMEIANNTATTAVDNTADGGLGAAAPGPTTGPAAALSATLGNVTLGTHSWRVSFVDGNGIETGVGPSSNVLNVNAARQVNLTAVPLGPAGTVKRRIYRTVTGNVGTPRFVGAITDNVTTTYTDNTGDAWLGDNGSTAPAPPTSALSAAVSATAGNVNTGTHSYRVTFIDGNNLESAAGPSSAVVTLPAARQVNLSAIPIGPAGVTKRRIYRTVAGNAGPALFVMEIANNTSPTAIDNLADAGLGAAAPPAAPSGTPLAALSAVAGVVTAGTHSYYVTFVDALNLESPAGPASNVVSAPGNVQVSLYAIPLGPAGSTVVRRRLYRSAAGNTVSPLFLVELADNTTTEYADNTPDGSLGAALSAARQLTVLSADRNFSVANNFLIPRGKFTLGAGVTVDAQNGLTAGDGVLPSSVPSDATLELIGNVTLRMGSAKTLQVNSDGTFFAGLLSSATAPTITRIAGGTFATLIQGVVDVTRLNFSAGDANGLNISTPASNVKNLRNITFAAQDASLAGTPASLTIAATNLNFDCPGCVFGTLRPLGVNVRAEGANTGMRLRFEDRGVAPPGGGGGGPGAGEGLDDDDDANANGQIDGAEAVGGSIVQWVYTVNVDMTGALQGFPEPAFDWNTFGFYSTYAVARQTFGNSDVIHGLSVTGDLRTGYSFSPGAAAGNITGPLFWDTEGAATHVVYFGTTTGLVYKLIDNGSSLALAPSPWDVPFFDATLKYVSTPIMSDRTNLYFGGSDNLDPNALAASWGLYRIIISTKTLSPTAINLGKASVTGASSWADTVSGRMIFQATGAVSGASSIYRVLTSSWMVNAQVNSTSSFTAPTNVPIDTLFVGEANGRMHAVSALGTSLQFVERTPFPFTLNSDAVSGTAVWENVNATRLPTLSGGRLFFGTATGNVFELYLYPATFNLGIDCYAVATPGGNPILSMPLVQDGILYVTTSKGNLFVYDADGGAGPALMTTYTWFANAAAGDVSRDPTFGSGRIYVGTGAGRLYALIPPGDPTGGVK